MKANRFCIIFQQYFQYMPLLKTIKPFEQSRIGIWKIQESESFFLDNLDLVEDERKQLNQIKGHRRIQWLSARYCLNVILEKKSSVICLKDQFGKPHLAELPYHISFSHSGKLSAVMYAPILCGIDIQQSVEKIYRIKEKFLSQSEMDFIKGENQMSNLHICWGAKESIFKAYGKKSVDFKKQIKLDHFSFSKGSPFTGHFEKSDYKASFDITYEVLENYYLVYVFEKENLTAKYD